MKNNSEKIEAGKTQLNKMRWIGFDLQKSYMIRIGCAISALLLVSGINLSLSAQNSAKSSYRFPYDLRYPTQQYVLPDELREVSGIALFDKNTIICIQDEKGKLFFYDLIQKKITKQVKFWDDGDFEDITISNNRIYAIRSDGLIVEIENFTSKETVNGTKHWTPLSLKNDCEGICYDSLTNSLLIALKELTGKKESENLPGFKAIYSFDLNTKTLSEKPAFLIEVSTLEIPDKHPSKSKKDPAEIKFKPSAVAIHPKTDEIYVLASVGKMLIVLNRKGEVIHKTGLDKKLYPQPEGITFSPDGTLFISNEGGEGVATLLRFKMK